MSEKNITIAEERQNSKPIAETLSERSLSLQTIDTCDSMLKQPQVVNTADKTASPVAVNALRNLRNRRTRLQNLEFYAAQISGYTNEIEQTAYDLLPHGGLEILPHCAVIRENLLSIVKILIVQTEKDTAEKSIREPESGYPAL